MTVLKERGDQGSVTDEATGLTTADSQENGGGQLRTQLSMVSSLPDAKARLAFQRANSS